MSEGARLEGDSSTTTTATSRSVRIGRSNLGLVVDTGPQSRALESLRWSRGCEYTRLCVCVYSCASAYARYARAHVTTVHDGDVSRTSYKLRVHNVRPLRRVSILIAARWREATPQRTPFTRSATSNKLTRPVRETGRSHRH